MEFKSSAELSNLDKKIILLVMSRNIEINFNNETELNDNFKKCIELLHKQQCNGNNGILVVAIRTLVPLVIDAIIEKIRRII